MGLMSPTQIERTPLSHVRIAGILIWIVPLFWSSNYLIARIANGNVPPHSLAFGRWLIALVLMLPWVWKDRHRIFKLAKAEWIACFILGALGIWICGAFVYIAAQTTTTANIALIYAAAPVGIGIISTYVLGVSWSVRQRLSVVFALLGVFFILTKGDLLSLRHIHFVAGDVWVLLATCSWVAYSILQQRWPSQLAPMQRLFCITTAGLVILLPFVLFESVTLSLGWVSPTSIGVMLIAGIFPGLLSYWAYSFIIGHLGAHKAGLILYLGPVYSAFTAWWLLGETPQWFHFAGAALVLPSIYLASTIPNRSRDD
jgi:drug/metabolite transporter (DMT)-like permease